MANKKVYFFRVTITDLKGNNISVDKYKELFEEIIDNHSVNNTTYKSLDLSFENDPMHTVWDIFNYKNDCLFGRLSRQRPSSSVIQRDYQTFQKSDVLPVGDQQNKGIEQYTFGSLDYDTGIFSIVSSKGSPNEKVLRNTFVKYNRNFILDLIPIPNPHGIENIYLGEGAEITRLEVEVPLPSAAVLSNLFEWDADEVVDAMTNRNLTAEVVLKPLRRHSITVDSDETKNLIDKIKNKLDFYKKAKMKAKTKKLKLRDYNFYDENFSYPIDVPLYYMQNYERIYYSVDEMVEIYKQNIVSAFRINKTILIEIVNSESD